MIPSDSAPTRPTSASHTHGRAALEVELARPGDAPRLLLLRDRAARWLRARGIEQWVSGEISIEDVRAQAYEGQWHVVRRAGTVRAAVRLLRSDVSVWGAGARDAAYVHGLVVDRSCAGQGLGAVLLGWAEGRALAGGRPVLRLDCVEGNARLLRYYIDRGYRVVGRREFRGLWHPAILLEKRLE